MKLHFNDGWYFTETYTDELPGFDAGRAKELTPVRLPHTVKELPLNYLNEQDYQMVSGYLHPLDVPADWSGKRVLLHFGAAAQEATVYCNGVEILRHRCGYTAFTAELTEYLNFGGENMICVRLDSRETLDQPPFGNVIDYLTYGGIYRAVTLEVTEASRISDLFIHAKHTGETAMRITVEHPGDLHLSGELRAPDGRLLGRLEGRADHRDYKITIPNPPVWSLGSPNLCTFTLRLLEGGRVVDERKTRFGFRTVDFRADGLYLNETRIQLRGLNRHQCWPYLGYAVPDRAQALDADILKFELGCNVVRTSHYPQSHAFIDRCDEIGLLVFTEMPGWQHIGGEDWKNQAVENVREMVTEYRNHPSIYIWGVRINESPDDDEFYRRTNEMAHRLDPSRPTGGVRNFRKSHLLEDVYTYNDFYHHGPNLGCEPKKAITPDMAKGHMITEYNGHMFPTKSFDWEGKRLEHALRHCRVLDTVRKNKDIAGSTGWCMFDYNTHQDFGSGDRVCYHGVMDMFRNPKLAAYAYAAEGCDTPVLAISSGMDIGEHPGGFINEIYAFTNAESVELYKNDEFITEFRGSKEYPHMLHGPVLIDDRIGSLLEKHESFDPKTAAGISECLNAVAKYGFGALPKKYMVKLGALMLKTRMTYDDGVRLYGKYVAGWGDKITCWRFVAKNGGETVAEVLKGPVQSVSLRVQTDTTTLVEGETWDMATLRFQAVDQNGNVLPYCSRVVSIAVDGVLELVGADHIALSGGMAGAYLKTTGVPGSARVILTCEGMEPVTLEFTVEV